MRARRAGLAAVVCLAAAATLAPVATAAPAGTAPPAPTATAAGHDPTRVRVDGGWLRGERTADVLRFSGVPYAAPPVGARRWTAPRPPEPWRGTRDATEAAAKCPQTGYDPGTGQQVVVGSEDCLYLDVVRPARPDRGGPLPVIVWLHGGNLTSGSGSEYDGARLAVGGDAVVVTVGYRLGALGFLSSPELDDRRTTSGNYGLLDQAEALRWVRRNARAFGGDPRRVTLAGQSAGARAVCAHLAAPGSRGLFQRAIVQSGPCTAPVRTKAEADAVGGVAIARLGCAEADDVEACLHRVPAAVLVERLADPGNPFLRERRDDPWGPVARTPVLPEQPGRALRRGRAADVPLLVGSTHDEARGAVLGRLPDLTEERYADLVGSVFGDDAEAVLAAYPAGDHASPALALARVLTDWGYACPTLTTARVAGRHAPVHAYELLEEPAEVDGVQYGAYHGWDLPFLWDTAIPGSQYPELTAPQERLSATLIGYWTSFARTGDPDGAHRPPWRPFGERRTVLGLAADEISPVPVAADHRCGFWRGI